MGGMNRVFLIGNLGAAPEHRQLPSGDGMATFSVATTYAKKEGDSWVDGTDWHRITVFGKTADNCMRYLDKGSLVQVEGMLRTRSYDKDGKTHYKTEVKTKAVTFLGKSRGGSAYQGGATA